MLSRRERLTTREFAAVFDRGRVLRHPLLQARVVARCHKRDGESASGGTLRDMPPDAGPRAAFVVSKKMGKAVLRNRVRRRMREAYRLSTLRHDSRLAGLDFIFMAMPPALTAQQEPLQEAMKQLSQRAVAHHVAAHGMAAYRKNEE